MKDASISFIGGGNMAAALIGGLLADGYPAAMIQVSDPDQTRLQTLTARYPVQVTTDNQVALSEADVVVLAVKPQRVKSVALELADRLKARSPLVISIAAGIQSQELCQWFGAQTAVVRVMPNTPALVRSGASALFATASVTLEQREQAECLMRAVGLTLWLDDEPLMDAVTALSGSGPAYFFLFMELLEASAIKLGLSQEQARLLTIQTAFGAAKMALESDLDPGQLRRQVTSPGGTTERALKTFAEQGIEVIFEKALTAAAQRSAELAHHYKE